MRFVIVLVALLCALACARRIGDLDRLVAKEQLRELHWFYNTNMDAAAAIRSKLGPAGTSTEFQQRVANVISVFCPDPIFQGWFARTGLDGSSPLTALHRDTPSTPLDFSNPAAFATLSVVQMYRDLLPGVIFINSSQHMVGMEIITVYYGDDGVMRAEFNATLRQIFNQGPVQPGALTESLGHYNNLFMKIDDDGDNDGRWCMYQVRNFFFGFFT